MQANIELKRVVAEIYSYVIAAQVKYCKGDMKHPFFEQTYLNIAMFNRGMRKHADALAIWQRLEALQRELYGEESPLLLHTLKNIGTCYTGLGKSEEARGYLSNVVDIITRCGSAKDSDDTKRKDKEDIAGIYQSFYLTHVADRDFEKALEYTEKSHEIIKDIYGERSKRVASKYYQKANSCLILGRKDEAIANIEKAIDVHTNPAVDKYIPKDGAQTTVAKDASDFNRIQFQNFLCSSLYMQGKQLDRVVTEAQKGSTMCSAYQYAPLKPECDRMKLEFDGMVCKAKAMKENMSALEYKAREAGAEEAPEVPEQKIIAQKSTVSAGQATATFFLSTGLALAGILAY